MKYQGSILEYTAERNADLLRAFRLCLETCDRIVLPDFFERVVNTPASRFWVSSERASIVVARIEAGKPLARMRPTKREMFHEIHRRYLLLKDEYPELPPGRVVEMVVLQPAPKFYLTPGYALQMFYKIRRDKLKDIKYDANESRAMLASPLPSDANIQHG